MESILTGSIFSGEHFVLGSIFWRAFFGEHLAGSIFSGSIWVYTRQVYVVTISIPIWSCSLKSVTNVYNIMYL